MTLNEFIKFIKISPNLLVSDGDLAIISSVKKVLKPKYYQLFEWHLKINIQKNLSYLKKGEKEGSEIYPGLLKNYKASNKRRIHQ